MAATVEDSLRWRVAYTRAFVERDVPHLSPRVAAPTIKRLWSMCAHLHGQLLNLSLLGQALGVSHHTARSYLELLERTFMIRLLPPLRAKVKKRLTKAPRVYVRDTGILHSLLDLETFDDLLGHPVCGASFEGFVVENLLALASRWKASFYRTQDGAEIDLVLERGRRRVAVECKASSAPSLTRGTRTALADLDATEAYVVAPIDAPFPLGQRVTAVSPSMLLDLLEPGEA